VGQAVVELHRMFHAGVNQPEWGFGNLLFLGETVIGDRRAVNLTVEVPFGRLLAVIKVDCAEFPYSQQIAKVIGAPRSLVPRRNASSNRQGSVRTLSRCKNEDLPFLQREEAKWARCALGIRCRTRRTSPRGVYGNRSLR
jgi:hypothetical protein